MKQVVDSNADGNGPRLAVLCAVLLLTSRAFQYFPGFQYVQEAAFVLALLALPTVALLAAPRTLWRTPVFEAYVLLVMLAMPPWAGLAAQQAHGQPVVYGVAALRGFGLIAVALCLLYALRSRWISVRDVGQAMVICAWGTLALYLLMDLVLDAENFVSYGIGLVEVRVGEATRFKFNAAFITYAVFHYAVRAYRERQPALYGYALLFFFYMLGSAGGRLLTVALVSTALVLAWRWGGWRNLLKGMAALGLLGALTVGVGLVAAPDSTQERLGKFVDAFQVFGGDADVIDDSSAASRVLQTLIAAPLIEERPLAGNGRVSAQWVEDSFAGLMGEHFYPDDIGIVGMVYQYGVLGALLCAAQFGFALYFGLKASRGPRSVVGAACAAYLVYLAITSLGTGNFATFPEFNLLLVAVLAFLAGQPRPRQRASQPAVPRSTPRQRPTAQAPAPA